MNNQEKKVPKEILKPSDLGKEAKEMAQQVKQQLDEARYRNEHPIKEKQKTPEEIEQEIKTEVEYNVTQYETYFKEHLDEMDEWSIEEFNNTTHKSRVEAEIKIITKYRKLAEEKIKEMEKEEQIKQGKWKESRKNHKRETITTQEQPQQKESSTFDDVMWVVAAGIIFVVFTFAVVYVKYGKIWKNK